MSYQDPYPPEISDVIIDYDPSTLERRPVKKTAALAHFPPKTRAYRIIQGLPTDEADILDPQAISALFINAHNEMQRLWEEFRHGARVASLLVPLVRVLQDRYPSRPIRIVDVGCGLGYVLRWIAAHRALPEDVELLGVDYNATLIQHAQKLAEIEGLSCQFRVANAFHLPESASIYISSGVLHHFRGPALTTFFQQQAACEPFAFAHFDIQRSPLAPLGAGLFHYARMRQPLAQHDGTLSALRAHPTPALFQAFATGAPSYQALHFNPMWPWLPFLRTMHGLLGVREELVPLLRPLLDRRFVWKDFPASPHPPEI
ncbi:MAG: class I SAM-dependent methyltransferase [Myxococcales bacterium]|nr:class I SAM-dependent methyltransferase [Myxococcales bacterium]